MQRPTEAEVRAEPANLNALFGKTLFGREAKVAAAPVRPRPRKFRAVGRVRRDDPPRIGTIGRLRCGRHEHDNVRIVCVTTFDPEEKTVGVIVEMEQP